MSQGEAYPACCDSSAAFVFPPCWPPDWQQKHHPMPMLLSGTPPEVPVPEISPPRPSRSAGIPTERTLLKADLRFAAQIAGHNADDVEAAGRRPVTRQSPNVLPSYGQDVPFLVPVNCGRGRREIGAGPRFDLDEA